MDGNDVARLREFRGALDRAQRCLRPCRDSASLPLVATWNSVAPSVVASRAMPRNVKTVVLMIGTSEMLRAN